MVFQGKDHQLWTMLRPTTKTSCVHHEPFSNLDPLRLVSQMLPESKLRDLVKICIDWDLVTYSEKLRFLSTSIIPVWTADTTRGWNGRAKADAAIKNFGFSSLRALVRHYKNKQQMINLWSVSWNLTSPRFEFGQKLSTYYCSCGYHCVISPSKVLPKLPSWRMIQTRCDSNSD